MSKIKKVVAPTLFGFFGVSLLLYLCFWQVGRLEWKQELLERIEKKLNAPPVPLPTSVSEKNDQYLKVVTDGYFLQNEIHILTSQKFKGPGFRVITPFVTKSGPIILVDRGFVVEEKKDSIRSNASAFVTGNLLWPDETDIFTPQPNIKKNIWFARDVKSMSSHLNTEPILLVVESEIPHSELIEPMPISINIPNNHLQYAITWFSLALIWFSMSIYFIWSRR